MNRRSFVGGVAGVAGLLAGRRALSDAAPGSVRVRLRPEEVLAQIPADFMGLGYEISSVSRAGLLSRRNGAYVQMVRTLGPNGVIRVGGNTSDYSVYAAGGEEVSQPKGTVVNERVLRELGGFLEATGWRLIWGVNLGERGVEEAVAEARAVLCGGRGEAAGGGDRQ